MTTSTTILNALRAGDSLDSIGLPKVDGFIDLRGFKAPRPRVVGTRGSPIGEMQLLQDPVVVRNARWNSIDFSRARLQSVLLFHSRIENCRFDGADLSHFAMWGTQVESSSFRFADLRRAALGGIGQDRSRNSFRNVDFSGADLRETVHGSADFRDCVFDDCNLTGVDFRADVFESCRFSGELREVLFYRQAFKLEEFPPNEMKNVDLRRAKLRMCAFRKLDLDTIRWPEDADHIVIRDLPAALDRGIELLESRSDLGARRLTVQLNMIKQWLGANQRVAVINRLDFIEMAGECATDELLLVMRPH